MATTIKLKNSVTTTNAPSSLAQGEVAINITDKKVWVGNAATTPIQLLGDGGSVTFTSLTVTGVSTFSAGTVSAPSITTTGDTNTGIFFPAADTIAFTEGGEESLRIDANKILYIRGQAIKVRNNSSNASYIEFEQNGSPNTANSYIGGDGRTTGFLNFSTNDTERMRIDSSGNVGIGTSSNFYTASGRGNLNIAGSSSAILGFQIGGTARGYYFHNGTDLQMWNEVAGANVFGTNALERMRIDSSGNVGIGTSSPGFRLDVSATNDLVRLTASAAGQMLAMVQSSANPVIMRMTNSSNNFWDTQVNTDNSISWDYNDTERMRITSGGDLLVATTTNDNASGVGFKVLGSNTTAPYVATVYNTSGSENNYLFYNTNATNNGYRFYVNVNGGIYNYSGNNSNLSDERTKENIELAGSYLSKICAIPVKTFNYKDEPTGEQKTLGVIAQDVEVIAPELVNNDGFGETKEGETPLKSIYTTDMMYAMMKSIQELNEKVEAQAAEIALLKSK
jgi:Chaperone of endosialidase